MYLNNKEYYEKVLSIYTISPAISSKLVSLIDFGVYLMHQFMANIPFIGIMPPGAYVPIDQRAPYKSFIFNFLGSFAISSSVKEYLVSPSFELVCNTIRSDGEWWLKPLYKILGSNFYKNYCINHKSIPGEENTGCYAEFNDFSTTKQSSFTRCVDESVLISKDTHGLQRLSTVVIKIDYSLGVKSNETLSSSELYSLKAHNNIFHKLPEQLNLYENDELKLKKAKKGNFNPKENKGVNFKLCVDTQQKGTKWTQTEELGDYLYKQFHFIIEIQSKLNFDLNEEPITLANEWEHVIEHIMNIAFEQTPSHSFKDINDLVNVYINGFILGHLDNKSECINVSINKDIWTTQPICDMMILNDGHFTYGFANSTHN